VTHVVATHDAGSVGEAFGVAFVRRAQQQRGGVDRATGNDHHVRTVDVDGLAPPDGDPCDLPSRGARLERFDEGAAEQLHVRMRERGPDADDLGVGFRLDETREAIASGAADARAVRRLRVVEKQSERERERVVAEAREVRTELLDPGFVTDGRMGIRRRGRRLGRVDPALPVDVIELLRARVVRLEGVVGNRPAGGDATLVPELSEILLAHPEQRCSVHLGVAAHPIVRAGLEAPTLRILPGLVGRVLAVEEDASAVPVVTFAREPVSALDQQDPLAGGSQGMREGPASGTGSDDDDVVDAFVHEVSRAVRCGGAWAVSASASTPRSSAASG